MVLADTSAWVDHLRGTRRIATLDLVTVPPVLQEVLHGADERNKYEFLHRTVTALLMLDDPMPRERFGEAAQIYLACRSEGLTIRSSVDCLIAASAIAHGAELLHNDRDFINIAKVVPLRLSNLSPT
ncbi:MAG TPA: PIN domain-containing protein [Thermoanaerobaculia bacterium]